MWIPVVAALVAGMGLVGTVSNSAVADPTPPPGDAQALAVDVYTEPGYHDVNGRKWHTTCEKYSSTVDRCRAEIMATQVRFVGDQYQEVTDWFFNNLTYKPSPREQWKGNPLAANGVVGGKHSWTSAEGRQWKTECDTAETGRNGCRSYIMSKDIVVKTLTPRTYERVDRWVFNNVVQFTVPKPVDPKPVPKIWCDNAPLPYNMALRNSDGLPYYTNAPYEPKAVYNPNTIANFIKNIARDGRLSTKQRECYAELAGNHLIDGSHTEGKGANTVRWFGYRFDFSANPTLPELSGDGDGWFSGLAQGGVLSAFVEMNQITGDSKWLEFGRQAFRSFDVPMKPDGTGGITNHITVNGKKVLWFEEYPTSPATSVLNGHLEAVIGLDIWFKSTGEVRAKQLRDEALDGLQPVLEQEQLEVQGGTLTSYDLVRGYWDKDRDYKASPIRLVSTDATQQPTATLNGIPVTVPLVEPSPAKPNVLKDPGMADEEGRWSQHWPQITTSSHAEMVGGRIVATTDGHGWQGVSQVVPGNTFEAGKKVALDLNAQLTTPGKNTQPGAAGKVAVYEQCPGKPTRLLFESQKMRSDKATDYTFSFHPVNVSCPMLLQLTTSSTGYKGTEISYDNVHLREADSVGSSASKFDIAPDNKDRFKFINRFVYAQPTSTLTLAGRGTIQVQAYEDGRWQTFSSVTLRTGQNAEVQIPERITGRNIHYGYHEHHVDELISLYDRTKADMESGKEREFLRTYALAWVPMAPSRTGKVPGRYVPGQAARMMSVDDPGDTYDIPIIDPFALLEEE